VTIPTERRPIGYWVKEVDRLLEASLDAILTGHGLSRRHWQVLHVIEQGGATNAEVDTRLAPFLTDAEPTMNGYIRDLRALGVAEESAGVLTLTPEGRALFDTLIAEVSEFRRRAVAGISREDYTLTVSVLERMTDNLTTEN
jgi:DNA-binding MarR family transcriptional regulator